MIVAISESTGCSKPSHDSSSILLMGANSGSVGRGKPFVPSPKKQSASEDSCMQRKRRIPSSGSLREETKVAALLWVFLAAWLKFAFIDQALAVRG